MGWCVRMTCFRLKMEFRAGAVEVGPGELIVVPKGVEHRPVAASPTVEVLLLERNTTLNTGSAAAELGGAVHAASRAGVPLTKTELGRIQ